MLVILAERLEPNGCKPTPRAGPRKVLTWHAAHPADAGGAGGGARCGIVWQCARGEIAQRSLRDIDLAGTANAPPARLAAGFAAGLEAHGLRLKRVPRDARGQSAEKRWCGSPHLDRAMTRHVETP